MFHALDKRSKAAMMDAAANLEKSYSIAKHRYALLVAMTTLDTGEIEHELAELTAELGG